MGNGGEVVKGGAHRAKRVKMGRKLALLVERAKEVADREEEKFDRVRNQSVRDRIEGKK